MAWVMYANDANGSLPPNVNGQAAADTQASWVSGWLDWTASNQDNYNLTNLTQALLGPYCNRSVGIYKCPADKLMPIGATRPRVRSVSMNGYIEGGAYLKQKSYGANRSVWYNGMFRAYNNQADLVNPSPSALIVFVDEHPDSINDGWMITDESPTGLADWEDLPASYHDNACGFGFADGHAEIHRWLSGSTLVPVLRVPGNNGKWQVGTDERDVLWMRQHATVAYNALP
jgi:prepilin-type processing-associated H-X9-DG protein